MDRASAVDRKTPVGLMNCPAEVHEQIFTYLLPSFWEETPMSRKNPFKSSVTKWRARTRYSALFTVNRIISQRALDLLYAQNILVINPHATDLKKLNPNIAIRFDTPDDLKQSWLKEWSERQPRYKRDAEQHIKGLPKMEWRGRTRVRANDIQRLLTVARVQRIQISLTFPTQDLADYPRGTTTPPAQKRARVVATLLKQIYLAKRVIEACPNLAYLKVVLNLDSRKLIEQAVYPNDDLFEAAVYTIVKNALRLFMTQTINKIQIEHPFSENSKKDIYAYWPAVNPLNRSVSEYEGKRPLGNAITFGLSLSQQHGVWKLMLLYSLTPADLTKSLEERRRADTTLRFATLKMRAYVVAKKDFVFLVAVKGPREMRACQIHYVQVTSSHGPGGLPTCPAVATSDSPKPPAALSDVTVKIDALDQDGAMQATKEVAIFLRERERKEKMEIKVSYDFVNEYYEGYLPPPQFARRMLHAFTEPETAVRGCKTVRFQGEESRGYDDLAFREAAAQMEN
ncbi:MAG: hypothetical protein M1822_002084 [Bathelium mastoideum]|nr:MAG: hypothetical protein M1822_002084 [Bathelium mastoideum]